MAKIIGTTTDRTTCECCGREDLKGTTVVQFDDAGADIRYYGCSCAAKALGIASKDVRKAAKKADEDARVAARKAKEARNEAINTETAAMVAANADFLKSIPNTLPVMAHRGIVTAYDYFKRMTDLCAYPDHLRVELNKVLAAA